MTVYLNLLSGSITGAVLNATAPVTLLNGFQGHVTFFFPSEVPLTPGTTYYFRPVIQNGESFSMGTDTKWHYPGGMAFARGQPAPDYDVWFREGIIIPEPSAGALLFVGLAAFLCHRRLLLHHTSAVKGGS